MDKLLEALKNILPTDQVVEVAKAVEEIITEQQKALENDFQEKLDAAYEQLSEERQHDETIAESGYKQAYDIIASLMNRLDEQRQEFETALEEGFTEALDELEQEKAKNKNIETEIYNEFDEKLKQMKDLMVDKVDQFLGLQEAEIYEHAKKDVMSDPRVLEQRVAVERMAEILSDYMSSDSLSGISTSKLEEASKFIENLKGQLRIVESKNVNLLRQNKKLNETVEATQRLVTESTRAERKERVNGKGKVSGRGQRVVPEQIISEYAAPNATSGSSNDRDLTEDRDPLNDLLVLSGLEEGN